LLSVVETSVMVNFERFVLGIVHQFFQLFAKQMYFSQIKWPKVCEERLVNKVVIDTKVESVLS